MSQSPTDALDALMADFAKQSGAMPKVNPPEAAKMLAEQTAPEVAGQPEPAPVQLEAPAPTAKPAEVVAAEATKKTRGRKAAAAATPPPSAGKAPESSGQSTQFAAAMSTEDLCAALWDRGYAVTLQLRTYTTAE